MSFASLKAEYAADMGDVRHACDCPFVLAHNAKRYGGLMLKKAGASAIDSVVMIVTDWWLSHYVLPDGNERRDYDETHKHLGTAIIHWLRVEAIRMHRDLHGGS